MLVFRVELHLDCALASRSCYHCTHAYIYIYIYTERTIQLYIYIYIRCCFFGDDASDADNQQDAKAGLIYIYIYIYITNSALYHYAVYISALASVSDAEANVALPCRPLANIAFSWRP